MKMIDQSSGLFPISLLHKFHHRDILLFSINKLSTANQSLQKNS